MLAKKKLHSLIQPAAVPGTVTPIEGEDEDQTHCEPPEAAARHGLRPCGCANKGRHRSGCPRAAGYADTPQPHRPAAPLPAPTPTPAPAAKPSSLLAGAAPKAEPRKAAEHTERDTVDGGLARLTVRMWQDELVKAYRFAHDVLEAHARNLEAEAGVIRKSAEVYAQKLVELERRLKGDGGRAGK